MTAPVTHPLVASWLRDLEHLLHGIDPGDRVEVLAGVREHLDASLPVGASDDEVRRTLAELGSPQAVADEAYAGRPASVRPLAPAVGTPPARGTLTQPWVPVMVGVFVTVSLVPMLFVAAGVVGLFFEITVRPGGVPQSVPITPMPAELMGWLLLTLVFTLPFTAALVVPSRLWSAGEKVRLLLLAPTTALVLAFVPWLGDVVSGSILGGAIAAAGGVVVMVVAAWYVLDRDLRAGFARSVPAPPVAAVADAGRSGLPRRRSPVTGYLASGVNALLVLALFFPTSLTLANPGGIILAASFLALPWAVVGVLTAVTPTWSRAERLVSLTVLPVTLVLLSATMVVVSGRSGTGYLSLLPAAVIVGAALWVITRLAHALRPPRRP